MLDSNGNKIPEKDVSEDYAFSVAEIRFLMKGFRRSPGISRAHSVSGFLKAFLDDKKIFSQIEYEDREFIEKSVDELEEYAYDEESAELLWDMVYLRRSLSAAYNYIDSKHNAAVSKFAGALHFDNICSISPTAYNFSARFCEYANTVKYIKNEPEVRDKWDLQRMKQLFARAENFVESKSLLDDDKYLEYAGYYYDVKRSYYRSISDELAEYQAAKNEMRYLWKRCCLFKSAAVLRETIKKYIDYTGYKRYSFNAEKQRFEELLELAEAWAEEENSLVAGGYYHRLLNRYNYFTD